MIFITKFERHFSFHVHFANGTVDLHVFMKKHSMHVPLTQKKIRDVVLGPNIECVVHVQRNGARLRAAHYQNSNRNEYY